MTRHSGKGRGPDGRYGLSRREFVASAAALGAAGSLAGSFAGKAAMAAETPQKGGHLVLGIDGASSTDSLDPLNLISYYQDTVGFQWGNCLVELDENNDAVPELATSWEPSDGGAAWVFKIREGVEFHNGKDLVAEDVVASINHHRGAETKSPAKPFVEPIAEIKATGKHEVTFTLKEPNVDLPYLMADFHLLVFPAGGPSDAGIGTGGYIIDEFVPGVTTESHRNPNYWKEGRAHVDTVETVAVNDTTARTNGVRDGSLHFVNRMNASTIDRLAQSDNVEVVEIPSSTYVGFVTRCDTEPYVNNDLRLALKYAIDREDLVQRVRQGFARVGNDHPVPEFDRFHADLPQRPYDPDKAKFHLKQSGFDGEMALHIGPGTFTNAEDVALLYQETARNAGLNLKVVRVPDDGYWSNVWMKDPFTGTYGSGRPTADMVLSLLYKSDAPWNETYWRREDFDQLLVAARGELDETKRRQMYHDVQEMIWQDGGSILPYFSNELYAQSDKLRGLVRAPVFSGYRVAEQVYFS